ncbi:hypothetical protein NDU88_000822 [Pleurodeles waltl]|uniref:Uncharacterized protein n=1 Tax=Pleurodeles waltl TaxID=8319 RepID=A0AAV7SXG7_PLEWA|nr:hypothetical protein NDU88_000822 [Pleurodeles waltl]
MWSRSMQARRPAMSVTVNVQCRMAAQILVCGGYQTLTAITLAIRSEGSPSHDAEQVSSPCKGSRQSGLAKMKAQIRASSKEEQSMETPAAVGHSAPLQQHHQKVGGGSSKGSPCRPGTPRPHPQARLRPLSQRILEDRVRPWHPEVSPMLPSVTRARAQLYVGVAAAFRGCNREQDDGG